MSKQILIIKGSPRKNGIRKAGFRNEKYDRTIIWIRKTKQ